MRISEVARFTKQPAEVAAFYATLFDRPPPEGTDETTIFDVGDATLLVHAAGDDTPPPGWPKDVDHVAFEVDDLDAECERLRAAGREITGPTDLPWGRSAYLYDPDGRMVELHGRPPT